MTKDRGPAVGTALQSHNEVMTRRSNKQQIVQVKQLPPPQPQVVLRSSSPARHTSSSSRPSPPRHLTTTAVADTQLKQRVPNAPPAQVFTRGTFGAVKTTRPASHGGGSSTAGSIDETSSRGSSAGGGGGRRPHRSTSRSKTMNRSHSQDPKNSNRQERRNDNPNSVVNRRNGRVRSRMATSQYPPQPTTRTNSRATKSVVVLPRSNVSVISSNTSEADQNSVHSAPSVYRSNSNPEWRSSGLSNPAVVEWREPVSSRQGSPSIIKQQQQQQQHHNSEHSSSSHQHQTTIRDVSPARSNKSNLAEDSQKNFMRTTKRVVEELIRAQGTRRRIEAVTNACEIFDHYDEARHNIELYQGAAQALAKLLEYPQPDDTIRMVCSALEMVFRGSTRTVQQSYSKCGSGLLTNLLNLLDRCEQGDVKHAHISILNITRILLYLSKCPDLRYPLCRSQDLLDCFTRVLTNNQLTCECRALRMRTLANLAAGDKNKVLIYEQIGLLYNVLRIANLDTSDLARQHAAAVLQELANCTFLHVSMASNDQLLGTLVKMALKEKSTQTRESAISALQTLAFTKENRLRLVEFKGGVVMEALRIAVSTDPDDKVRRRAAGALTNLACEDTAETMGNHKGLLGALAIVATKDANVDVQTRASLALTKIGSSINASMDCFETLLDSLVVASLSTTSNSVTAVLRVKAREPQNRERMARHSCVLDTLADVCVSPGAAIADRDNAMRTLMHLANGSRNRLVMCNKSILDALVIGANFEEPRLMEARESAIITLERLATEPSNRPRMARHAGLLVAVSRAAEREAKWEDAKIESEHGYLAKPLLMSLLLAM